MTPQQMNYSRAISSQATSKSQQNKEDDMPRGYTQHKYMSASQMLGKKKLENNSRKTASIGKNNFE